jgi:ubiquinone/menaquinone biosynthesis C-methylase UbiE
MNEFDIKAREWDNNPMHWERSETIARNILEMVPVHAKMKALEYGAGTGILSFLLSDKVDEITLMDNSREMVQVMLEKTKSSNIKKLKPLYFDLEHFDYQEQKFDLIYLTMVLHHVTDVHLLLNKFYKMLNPGGYVAIADLYAEDGSFHGEGFSGHNGFDVNILQKDLKKIGLSSVKSKNCYMVKKEVNGQLKDFPIFLMVANR